MNKQLLRFRSGNSQDSAQASSAGILSGGRRFIQDLMDPSAPSFKLNLIRIIAAVVCAVLLIVGNRIASNGLAGIHKENETVYLRARVIDLLNRDEQTYPLSETEVARVITLTFSAEILEGDQKGETIEVLQQSDPYYQAELNEVRVGDEVIISVVSDMDTVSYQYHEHVRVAPLIVLFIIFAVALLFVAQIKGLNFILVLGYGLLAVYAVLLPAVLSGQNIYVWTAIVALFLTVMPPILSYGVQSVSAVTILGSLSSVAVSMGIAALMSRLLTFTGIIDQQSNYLSQLNQNATIDLRSILFACLVLTAAGAYSSLSWKVASATHMELRESSDMNAYGIYRFALAVGRRRLTDYGQTLTIAFVGASLPITLLSFATTVSLLSLLNRELILFQMLQLMISLIGLLMTVILTAMFCSVLYTTLFRSDFAAAPISDGEEREREVRLPEQGFSVPAETRSEQGAEGPSFEEEPAVDSDPEKAFSMPEISEEEQQRRDEIDSVEEDPKQIQAYRSSLFGSFARLYHELDEDFDIADEHSKKKAERKKK